MSVELRHVVTVPVYSLSVVASVFAAFLLAGYHTNAARFAQLQYGYDYQHAWFYTSGQSTRHFSIPTLLYGSHQTTAHDRLLKQFTCIRTHCIKYGQARTTVPPNDEYGQLKASQRCPQAAA